ncbi:MAG: hypothetical protein ACT4PU_12360 [Planctomycetota bacterium]
MNAEPASMTGPAAIVLVYVTQLLAGLLLLGAADSLAGAARTPRRWHERLSRALLLGPLGITLQMLLLHAIDSPFELTAIVTPWWLAGAAAAGTALARRRRNSDQPALQARAGAEARAGGQARFAMGLPQRAALLLTVLLFLLALGQGLLLPVHTGDALLNFAQNARVFETHGNLAPEALAQLALPGHTEYPPLVALNETLLFFAGGPARALAIKPFFALAGWALLLLIVEACFSVLRGWRGAAVAALACCTPFFASQATEGYADLRLAAGVLLLALTARESNLLLFVLAGAACAFTKFEGLAVALVAVPVMFWLPLRRRALGATALLGLALIWPAWLSQQSLGTPPLAGSEWHDLGGALVRLPLAARDLAALMLGSDSAGHLSFGLFWPLCLAAVLAGLLRRDVSTRRRLALAALPLLLHLGLYAAVFALSPAELGWHLQTAGGRLLLHTTPWALLLALAALRDEDPTAPT